MEKRPKSYDAKSQKTRQWNSIEHEDVGKIFRTWLPIGNPLSKPRGEERCNKTIVVNLGGIQLDKCKSGRKNDGVPKTERRKRRTWVVKQDQ